MAWWKKEEQPLYEVGACTDVGRVRKENEDAFGRFPEHDARGAPDHLFVVADGMGGHIRGREASATAVDAVHHTYFAHAELPVNERLTRAFESANAQVYEMSGERGRRDTMGTTGTALALVAGRAYVAHVGDSRAYRINEQHTEQLTRDHTMVDEMRREGILTQQEARHHPQRNALTRAIGTEPHVQVDLIEAGVPQAGDRFLLCTDGLASIPVEEIREVVLGHSPQDACEQLVQRANASGGYDNVTALIVHVTKGKD